MSISNVGKKSGWSVHGFSDNMYRNFDEVLCRADEIRCALKAVGKMNRGGYPVFKFNVNCRSGLNGVTITLSADTKKQCVSLAYVMEDLFRYCSNIRENYQVNVMYNENNTLSYVFSKK